MYELTKEELESIKTKERINGRRDITDYFVFSIKNYYYELNIRGMQCLLENIIHFLSGETNTIQNTYGYSFHDYINNMRG